MNNRIKIVEYKENWSEYTLENGTIIKIKTSRDRYNFKR